MFRRVARDRLQSGDILPYRPAGTSGADGVGESAGGDFCRDVVLETLDIVEMGPFLLLASAREKADAIVEDAMREANTLREQAREEGLTAGREEANQDAQPAMTALANAGQALIIFEEQMIARYAPELTRLALEIAEKIVRRTVEADPAVVASVLAGARREVLDARHLRIRLHPLDRKWLSESRSDLISAGDDKSRVIEVVSDEDVERGGCRLETEIGVVDATLPVQLAEIRRQLLDEEFIEPSSEGIADVGGAAVAREL